MVRWERGVRTNFCVSTVRRQPHELMHPLSREVKMPPLLHNRVFFGRRRLRRERNDEELSGKAFYSEDRGRRRVWHVGARSNTTLFRSGVHFGVWGCTFLPVNRPRKWKAFAPVLCGFSTLKRKKPLAALTAYNPLSVLGPRPGSLIMIPSTL
jgi:hypothetical protein